MNREITAQHHRSRRTCITRADDLRPRTPEQRGKPWTFRKSVETFARVFLENLKCLRAFSATPTSTEWPAGFGDAPPTATPLEKVPSPLIVFSELGLAHAAKKPVVFTASQVDDVAFDLRHLRVIIYEVREPEWAARLKQSVTGYLRNASKEPGKSIHPFWQSVEEGEAITPQPLRRPS